MDYMDRLERVPAVFDVPNKKTSKEGKETPNYADSPSSSGCSSSKLVWGMVVGILGEYIRLRTV